MNKNYYVITNPEDGWDCVCGLYLANSEEEVALEYTIENGYNFTQEEASNWMENRNYIIHLTRLTEIK